MIFIHASPGFCSGLQACTFDPALKSTTSTSTTDEKNPSSATSGRFFVEKTPLHRDETSDKTTISLDVAGFDAAHLNVEIDDHVLTMSAERTNKLGDTFFVRRRLALKADIYDEDSVTATFNDGILVVTILKKSVMKARKVAISVLRSTTPSSVVQTSLATMTPAVGESNPSAATANDEDVIPPTPKDTNASSILQVDTDGAWEDVVRA